MATLGLLYHLTLHEQVALMTRARGWTVIVDTQIHDPASYTDIAGDWSKQETSTEEGYEGVLFPKGTNPMASLQPQLSFTEPSLLRPFEGAGFNQVRPVEKHYISRYGARKFYVLT